MIDGRLDNGSLGFFCAHPITFVGSGHIVGGASKLVDNLGINPPEPVLGCVIGARVAGHRASFLSLETLVPPPLSWPLLVGLQEDGGTCV